MSTVDKLDHKFYTGILNNRTLKIPFQNAKQAHIAKQVLEPDPVLNPNDFHMDYIIGTPSSTLVIIFHSVDDRLLRVGVNNCIESIKTIIETFDEL
ncbi:related to Polarized growth chromatin-associated controller 1 [Saccharomycodes ludwigii]|uniref:Related to Polarized growth chromatin-associated controller 1 n=1 Tax=Saccharomycodes ludwigii TaxID=36035 RepID=A0A376B2V2_9ASCO|nr:hypothetical protein SCDLUD_005306 [Saccharomycodes ludwigii]KAH3898959.1 hypothetical protein SCDLUD_005306 [Saccharomycodes ludwigii]SSD58981.1 related to Polarized growth chromatin-associated controller 1 [Saccharomycodes ludwigii]